MNCEQAQQLFDAYLDGDLSPTLATELGAHRLKCPECRRQLALLEVSGHIISSDREPVSLESGFTSRLLGCMDLRKPRWSARLPRIAYIGGPLAAAAVIALAFLGVFDRPDTMRAGLKEFRTVDAPPAEDSGRSGFSRDGAPEGEKTSTPDVDERLLEEWIEQTRSSIAAKRESSESLQKVFDLTVLQLLDILDQARTAPAGKDEAFERNMETPRTGTDAEAAGGDDVEDL